MFFRILKKDLKRKKSMNIILLIFIMLTTIFLASGVNNLMAVSTSVNYFMDKAKTPDYVVSTNSRGKSPELIKWLNSSKYINSYTEDISTLITKDNIRIKRGDKVKNFEPFGQILLGAEPKKHGKLLDGSGKEVNLKSGEIAFSEADKRKNNLKLGDKVIITVGSIKKEFIIKKFTKDAIFGSTMMEMKRVIISDNDYDSIKAYKGISKLIDYYIMSRNTNALEKEFKGINCNTIINFDKAVLNTTFILDMFPSAILIIVSICLILIAFLILRFTIVFTLQDDFKEVGVMKAIGLRNFDIKKIYLIKYLGLTIIGVVIGFFMSFPFGDMLLNQSSGNILMKPSAGNISVNVICSILIVVLVVLFCYTCTRKLNKISAVDAIRNGSNGESFNGKRILKLKNFQKVNVPVLIAINDILSNFKRYVVLMLAFCIGTALIIVPLNTINTLKGKEIINLFGVKYSDVFIQTNKMDQYAKQGNKKEYLKDMDNLKKSFKKNGAAMRLYGEVMYRLKFYAGDKDNILQLMAMQAVNSPYNNYAVLKGKMPSQGNEIAITEIVAKKLKVSIGDTIYVQMGAQKKDLIVTGLYESMNNMGQSVRLSPKMEIDFKYLAELLPFQGNFQVKKNQAALIKKLKNKYPNYIFENSKQYLSKYLGNTLNQLDAMKNLIVIMVLGINGLITILMMKTFISKEKGEIALLKSIGFRNSSIRLWQSARISIVLLIAIILGIILTYILGPVAVNQVFAMMGVHNLELKVKPLEVYLFYPLLLLVITTAIAYIGNGEVKKVDLKEINNME